LWTWLGSGVVCLSDFLVWATQYGIHPFFFGQEIFRQSRKNGILFYELRAMV